MAEPFRIHILGCGSALPTPRHQPSAQVVEVRGKYFMVDCGEGTQLQMRRAHINFNKIQAVFISHLHGDHCFGLLGMLSTFGLLGRKAPLQIFAPVQLEQVLMLERDVFFRSNFGFEVCFHGIETREPAVIYGDRSLEVTAIPLRHRVPTFGFLFREKPTLPHIRRDMIDALGIPLSQINSIKQGADWTAPDGRTYKHEQLTTPPDATRSYAYISDTRYMPDLAELLQQVDVLYHESTYADDCQAAAQTYFHSTAREAAMVARDAHCSRLQLGHYSSRYTDESLLLEQAREVFPQAFLSNEGDIIEV